MERRACRMGGCWELLELCCLFLWGQSSLFIFLFITVPSMDWNVSSPHPNWASLVAQMVKNLPCSVGDLGSILGSGRSPGEGNGNPLQYCSLGNSVHGGFVESSKPQWDGIWRWGHEDGALMVGLVPLEKEMPESLFSLPGLWGRRKCICKSGEELLMETKLSDSLTLNLPASSTVRKYVSGFEAP